MQTLSFRAFPRSLTLGTHDARSVLSEIASSCRNLRFKIQPYQVHSHPLFHYVTVTRSIVNRAPTTHDPRSFHSRESHRLDAF